MKNVFVAILFLGFSIGFGQNKTAVKKEPVKDVVSSPEVKKPILYKGDITAKSDPNAKSEFINDDLTDYSQIFTTVDVPAEPVGGINEFRKKIGQAFKTQDIDEGLTASIVIKFVVSEDGTLSQFQIVKETPVGLGLGKEAIRVFSASEKWRPAIVNGRSVKQYYVIPFQIQIQGSDEAPKSSKVFNEVETPNSSKEKTTDSTDYSQIFNSVHVYAQPPGGMNAFRKMIGTSFNLPNVQEKTIGKVIAKFVVWDDGSIKDIQIIKETPENLGLGNEAIRILSSSDKWIPGVVNGRKVKQYFTLPIVMEMVPQMRMKQPMEEIKKD